MPATVATAVALPQAIARAMTKSTDGPGAKIIMIAAMQYSQILEGMTTKSNMAGSLPALLSACISPINLV